MLFQSLAKPPIQQERVKRALTGAAAYNCSVHLERILIRIGSLKFVTLMSSPAITTIVKMVESLPNSLQERVAEHIREFIADLEEDAKWEASFTKTHDRLIASAQKAKQEIVEGKSTPMDYERL